MTVCPFCKATYNSTMPPANLSNRQREIYNTIVEAGPMGIKTKDILASVYGDHPPPSAWGVLRVNVFEINRKIRDHGQRIKGRRDVGYVLLPLFSLTETVS